MDAARAPNPPWDEAWFDACTRQAMLSWRGVETQAQSATWRLVDSLAEHEALEDMLEASKPALPEGAAQLHYLLFTPFRYSSPNASRFRRPGEAGVWYGAETVQTVCAELAYWRHRFILDCASMAKDSAGLLTYHTLFQAEVSGLALDLTAQPWLACRAHWTHGSDYAATQAVADHARARGLDWIRYESVRQPGTACAAALSPRALANTEPSGQQEWVCHATRQRVILTSVAGTERFSWDF